ncbi:MAG: hypothetical protein ACI4LK_02305 [Lentihominibacter sp.]
MIPGKMLEKYSMNTLETYKYDFGDTIDTEIGFYRTFLSQTDYICNKIVEGVSTKEDYEEELHYRNVARQEIARLNGSTVEE